jgi:hypothetical protein
VELYLHSPIHFHGVVPVKAQRVKVAGAWRRLHNEELRNLYASSNIIRMIRSRRMQLVGHVARMGEKRKAYIYLLENLKGRDNLKDLGMDGKIILEWILGK